MKSVLEWVEKRVNNRTSIISEKVTKDNISKSNKHLAISIILLVISLILYAVFSLLLYSNGISHKTCCINIIFYVLTFSSAGLLLYIPKYIIFNNTYLSKVKIDVLIAGIFFTVIIFAIIFHISYMIDSENFHFGADHEKDFLTFLYFSFITITTTGYGDIVPLSIISKILVISEVLFGIIYFTFGLFVIAKNNDEEIRKVL